MASSSTPGADPPWPEMDINISDAESDQESEAGTSPLGDDSDLEYDSCSNDEFNASTLHPCLEPTSKVS